jgi:hypothetical protein
VTRAADLVTVKQVPAFGNAYSLSWSGNNTQTANSTQSFVGVYAGDGGNSNLIEFQRQSSCSGCITVPIRVGNAGQTGPGNIGAGAQSMKLAGSFANGAQNFVGNGTGTPFTTAAGTVLPGPTTLTNVTLGSTAFSTSFWDGTISRVAIWPNQALALSQLQSLTR